MPAMSGIEFEIVGSTTSAVVSIRALRKELAGLAKIHIGDLGLKSASTQISAFAKAVKQVDTEKMKALGSALKGLGQVGNSITALERFAEAPQKALSGLELLEGCLKELGQIDLSNLENASNGITNIVNSMKTIAGTEQPVKTVVGEVDRFRTALTKIGEVGKSAGLGFLRFQFGGLKQTLSGVVDKASNLGRSLMRIAMYRMLRTVIKEITQAFTVGVKNLYGWSKAMNGVAMGSMFANTKLRTFAQTMDGLSSSSAYLKNSIGAAVAPFISSLAPAIDFAIGKIVALINVLNQLFALLGGAAGWNKAIYKANEFEDAAGGAGGAAKEALRYLAPFDELNVLPDDNGGGGGGGGTDYDGMFEESEFMQGIKDFAQMVKDAWASGDWEDVGRFIGDKLNEAIDNVPWASLGATLGKSINALMGTEYWTLKEVNFTNLGNRIAEFLNNALENINFDIAGRLPVRKLTAIIDTVIGFLEGLDWGLVGKSIGDYLKGAFSEITDWFDGTDFNLLGESLVNGLFDMVSNLDFRNVAIGLWNALVSALQASLSLSTGMLDAFWNRIIGWFETRFNTDLSFLKIDLSGLADVINDGLENLKIDPIEVPAEGKVEKVTIDKKKTKKQSIPVTGSVDDLKSDTLKKEQKLIRGMTGRIEEVDKTNLTPEQKVIDAKANFTSRSEGSRFNTTFDSKANFKTRSISGLDTTFPSVAEFRSKKTANTFTTTFDSVANFHSRKTDSNFSTTFNSTANFTNRTSSISTTFDSTSKFTKWQDKLPERPVINATAKITKVSGVNGMTNEVKAGGGVFSGGKWHNIARYASGGLPRGSQLFWARENGAELVGTLGGHTAVMNNDQIVASVSAGVARAIAGIQFHMTGMPVATYGGSEPEVTEDMIYRAVKRVADETDFNPEVNLDGETLYRSIVRHNKQNARATGVNQLATAM